MAFTSGPELTTALTNLINSLAAFSCTLWFIRRGLDIKRYRMWFSAYLFLFLNSLIGFVLHGFHLPDKENIILWSILYLLLGLMLGMYVLAVRYDVSGESGFARFGYIHQSVSLAVSLIVAAVNIYDYHYSFPLFSLYAVSNVVYIFYLVIRKSKENPDFLWYLLAVSFFVSGSIIQALPSFKFTFILEFDHNSIYHLFVLVFLLLQFVGIRKVGS